MAGYADPQAAPNAVLPADSASDGGLSEEDAAAAGVEPPYLYKIIRERRMNPNFPQNAECACGHPYYRHFDWMEEDAAVGCKYCECFTFKLAT